MSSRAWGPKSLPGSKHEPNLEIRYFTPSGGLALWPRLMVRVFRTFSGVATDLRMSDRTGSSWEKTEVIPPEIIPYYIEMLRDVCSDTKEEERGA